MVDENLIINFGRINSAIQAFVAELKALNLWNSTTVVQFSDFARTLNPNTGDGSDHGWYGIYWAADLLLSFIPRKFSFSPHRSRVERYLVGTLATSTKAKATTLL